MREILFMTRCLWQDEPYTSVVSNKTVKEETVCRILLAKLLYFNCRDFSGSKILFLVYFYTVQPSHRTRCSVKGVPLGNPTPQSPWLTSCLCTVVSHWRIIPVKFKSCQENHVCRSYTDRDLTRRVSLKFYHDVTCVEHNLFGSSLPRGCFLERYLTLPGTFFSLE